MAAASVHFAVGMATAAVVGLACVALRRRRRRWIVWLPLLMGLCGLLAVAPALVTGSAHTPADDGTPHSPFLNVLFFYSAVSAAPALEGGWASGFAFQAVMLAHLAAMCGYVAYIRFALPRAPRAPEAFERMGEAAEGYRPLGALAAVVPLVCLGAAVGWVVYQERSPSTHPLEAQEAQAWARLVHRRLRVHPGPQLGLAHALPWEPSEGTWLAGDLAAHTTHSGGAASIDAVAHSAVLNGCDFLVLADGTQSPAYAKALTEARARHGKLAILRGAAWRTGDNATGGSALAFVAPGPDEGACLEDVRRNVPCRATGTDAQATAADAAVLSGPTSARSGEQWGQLFAWSRAAEQFLGILALTESRRSGGVWSQLLAWPQSDRGLLGFLGLTTARQAAVSRWDPRVAQVGGLWDRCLDRGFRLWGAAAASGFHDPKRHFWPGGFVRTHVFCPGRSGGDVLAGLRAGCFWAEEGGIVSAVDLTLTAPHLRRPARMGEVAVVAPGAEAIVGLRLELPRSGHGGGANESIDVVEVISNFDGEPQVAHTFHGVGSGHYVRFTFPPAADNNGGLGFYVRVRGWRRLGGGPALFFYTNPIRVLVRDLAAPPEPASPAGLLAAQPPAVPRPKPGPPDKPRPEPPKPAPQPDYRSRKALQDIGLPPESPVVHIETFRTKPTLHWRGVWTHHAVGRGPAMGDLKHRISFLRTIEAAEDARLFFRCYAAECLKLTVLLHTSHGTRPYQLVRELREQKWAELDLSLCEDFLPPRGAPGRLRRPAKIRAIEWRIAPAGPRASLHLTDFVVFRDSAARRLAVLRRRADELSAEASRLRRAPAPSRKWLARANALGARLAARRDQLDAGAADDGLAAVRSELDALAEEARRLGLQAAAARGLGLQEPQFAVSLESPTQRISTRNPACAFRGDVAAAYQLRAAGGEAESVQILVFALWQRLDAVKVAWSGLKPEKGDGPGLPASAISAHVATELWTQPRPDTIPQRTGWLPDPLLPLTRFDVAPGSLRSVLLTVHVPSELPPGDYRGTVTVHPLGLEPVRLTVRLHRWDFAVTLAHLAVVAPIDWHLLRQQYRVKGRLDAGRRRQLYGLLLRHRVGPIPGLSGRPEADLGDVVFCLERGLGLVVLDQTTANAAAARSPGIARAGDYARRLWGEQWGRRCAVVLRAPGSARASALAVALNTLRTRFPLLLTVASGGGLPPRDLAATYWRRPLGSGAEPRPGTHELEARRTRSIRRTAWHIPSGMPVYPQPNLTLANRLVECRLIPWLAWNHGVRAIFLAGVNRWQGNPAADGLLVYPGPTGQLYPSLRLVALRDGIEDYEYLWLIWDRARQLRRRAPDDPTGLAAAALQFLGEIETRAGSPMRTSQDPHAIDALRRRAGDLLERLEAACWDEIDLANARPAPPAQLRATAGDRLVALTWTRSPEPRVRAYNIYRSGHPERGFARINREPVPALRYRDRTVRNGTTYHYFLRAWRGPDVEGRRSLSAQATPRPSPQVVWGKMPDLVHTSIGPYRVRVHLKGPGTSGVITRFRPQLGYTLSDGVYAGFKEMTRQKDGSWSFDIPDLQWRRNASRSLLFRVRLVDRNDRVVVPAVERQELIDSTSLKRP